MRSTASSSKWPNTSSDYHLTDLVFDNNRLSSLQDEPPGADIDLVLQRLEAWLTSLKLGVRNYSLESETRATQYDEESNQNRSRRKRMLTDVSEVRCRRIAVTPEHLARWPSHIHNPCIPEAY